MEIKFNITYHDPSSDEQYEDHAETLEEAEQVKADLLDEGYKNVRINRIRE